MSEVCPKCGLPEELCVCETIAKETQKIRVYIVKKKFGKKYTVIEGIDDKNIDLKELVKKLKTRFACGGTVKDGKIELQGNHSQNAKKFLVEAGFPQESIDVKQR